MDAEEDSGRFGLIPAMTTRNMSSSSSVFLSANQSPFVSPRSPACQKSESLRSKIPYASIQFTYNPLSSSSGIPDPESHAKATSNLSNMSSIPVTSVISDMNDNISSSTETTNRYSKPRSNQGSYIPASASLSYNRLRSCDVFIGLHGRKPFLLRFANWLRAELEIQGMSCFVSDRARCRNSRKHGVIERAMDVSSFGVIILTKKSFRNPYTIEELRFFSGKKNLVPIFFDLSPADCLARDIVEKRGELWEKHGGELWVLYGGLEKEWKEAINGLSRIDEWKLQAYDGNWRDCISRVVTLLAMKLGRRSVVERMIKWTEKVEKEEFPFPRHENFIGRKKELSELEFILFGDASGDLSERDHFELKARSRRKYLTSGSSMEERRSKKGKEPVIWKELEKEIEMQSNHNSQKHYRVKPRSIGRNFRKKSSVKIMYGKGIACVSGDSGIGKSELLLEFAYRYQQRYKMVLWIGGESRYIRQNYLNLWSFLEVDVAIQNCSDKNRIKTFEEHEEAAISRARKELMRNIPFLVVIDNLESEKDWWDHELIMDLLPRFGGETHIIIATRLSRVMNLEPLKLSYLSEVEAMSLMQQGSDKDYSIAEIDSLRAIEEKLGRLTLGLAIVGSILSELPINPSRLLDTINRMPLREVQSLKCNSFLLQLFEVCFSIFDHADGPRSLATRMVQASGWFAPSPIPIPLLVFAANKIPEKPKRSRLWRKILNSLNRGLTSSYSKRSEAEASSMLLRFSIARSSTRPGHICFNELVKLYARKRGVTTTAKAMVQAVLSQGSISQNSEHIWAACFLIFGFGKDPTGVVELKVSELLSFIKEVVLPLGIRTFITFSRCKAALEVLRLCTEALEAADEAFVTPVEKWLDKSLCWRSLQTDAQLNPYLWQELALCRATVLETRAKLMLRGGQFDIADDLIRKTIFIRSSICGEDHPDTVLAKETLGKITRLVANVQKHNTSSS